MNPEVFYLQVDGAQRGPYTISQIDHLLNSRLITQEASYWREGMEGWFPVTDLVKLRTPLNRWIIPGILALLLLGGLVLAQFLGPTLMVGWREMAQYEFTPHAAYWRSRDIVRQKALPAGTLVAFTSEKNARITLQVQPAGATVWLTGEVMDSRGKSRQVHWRVTLAYQATTKEWSGLAAQEEPQP